MSLLRAGTFLISRQVMHCQKIVSQGSLSLWLSKCPLWVKQCCEKLSFAAMASAVQDNRQSVGGCCSLRWTVNICILSRLEAAFGVKMTIMMAFLSRLLSTQLFICFQAHPINAVKSLASRRQGAVMYAASDKKGWCSVESCWARPMPSKATSWMVYSLLSPRTGYYTNVRIAAQQYPSHDGALHFALSLDGPTCIEVIHRNCEVLLRRKGTKGFEEVAYDLDVIVWYLAWGNPVGHGNVVVEDVQVMYCACLRVWNSLA